MATQHADILILGGGSGGMDLYRFLSRRLKRAKSKRTITLVDTKDHFVFVPLLHEVGAGTIKGKTASVHFKQIVSKPHHVLQATVQHINPAAKKVQTNHGTMTYDTCVIALGSQTNFFDTPGAKEHTHTIRSRKNAEALITAIEKKKATGEHIAINIIGGGFTGVEIASEIAYRHRSYKNKTITLVHSRDALVQTMPLTLQKKATRRLKKLGVNILFNGRATQVTQDTVHLADGSQLPNDITIWATGFLCTADTLLPETAKTDRGRIPVNEFLQTQQPHTYAMGDVSLFFQNHADQPIPQLAEVAWHQAIYIAKHITNEAVGKKTKPFRFHSLGSLLPLGNWYGTAVVGPIPFSGPLAWIIRQASYVFFFPTIRGKLKLVRAWLHPSIKKHQH